MVEKKNLILCIHSKQLKTKLVNALQTSFNLILKDELNEHTAPIIPNISFCIIDAGTFRRGGKEFFLKTRDTSPHTGKAIIGKRMTIKEMKEAVNECHVYAIWGTDIPPEELVQTLHKTIEKRECRLDNITRKDEFDLLKNEKENLIDAFNHEVRSAIAPIQLSLRVLKNEISSEKSSKVFQRIDNKLIRLTKIMQRLLSFQSLEKGKYFFRVAELNLSETINAIIESALFFIEEEERKVIITSSIPDDVTIIFDELMLGLTLEEVLQNAVKYTTDNSSIHISLQEEKHFHKIIVEDKGIGLNHDDLDSIWDIGYENLQQENRSSGYYKFRSSGVGLGLSLVKKYLAMLGGDCSIESNQRCPAVPICIPEDCPLAGAEKSMCEEMVRINCQYICPGDTKKCEIIGKDLGLGWCPGSKVTITLPR